MPDLPFQVGDLAESRSFQGGFRGAWFRCKAKDHYRLLTRLVQSGNIATHWKKITGALFIRDIRSKNAVVSHLLDYFDYPDQKPCWIKLYQKPLTNIGKSKGSCKKELVLRPSFPTLSYESEKLDVNTISEVIVIVNNIWKVGDLVDWFADGCYWSGSVTKILGNDKVKIDLLPPPLGEGLSYEALSKDLRPSLDWCPEKGWTVPMPMGGECRQRCARIINPANSVDIHATTDAGVKVGQHTVRTYSPPSSLNLNDRPARSMTRRKCNNARNDMEIDDSGAKVERACFSEDKVSSSHVIDSEKATINDGYNEYSTKKRCDRSLCLNSMSSNTIEAAIMDLEELVNKIKWLRGVLNLRVQPLSDTKRPSWEFSQHHAPCK